MKEADYCLGAGFGLDTIMISLNDFTSSGGGEGRSRKMNSHISMRKRKGRTVL